MFGHSKTLASASLVAMAAFLASPALTINLKPERYVSTRTAQTVRTREANSSAISRILGEVRSSFSDMMFMKTEIYLHSGIGYATHLDASAMASKGETKNVTSKAQLNASADANLVSSIELEVKEMGIKPGETNSHDHDHDHDGKHTHAAGDHHDHDHDHDHIEAESNIPTQQDDFRGFIGDLERKVKPWQDPRITHKHTAGTELLPWYRLMTLTDPHNVRGYMIGTWWLNSPQTGTDPNEALKFIDEGIANNPEEYQLHLMRGRVLDGLNRAGDALAAFRKAFELGTKYRPAEGVNEETWTNYMEDDLRAAAHFTIINLRDAGRIKEAVAACEAFIKSTGDPTNTIRSFLADAAAGKYIEGVKSEQPKE